MGFLVGSLLPDSIYYGDTLAAKLYRGQDLIWAGSTYLLQDTQEPIGPTITSDSFNRVNSTGLGSTDIANGGVVKTWTTTGQTNIVSNKAGNIAYNTSRMSTVDLGFTDHYVRQDNLYLNGGLTFRYTDSNNYYRLEQLNNDGSYGIVRRVAGVNTTIGTGPAGSFQVGLTIGAAIKNDIITVFRGTTKVGTHKDTNPIVTGTRAGSMSNWSGEWYTDNFFAAEYLEPTIAPPPVVSTAEPLGTVIASDSFNRANSSSLGTSDSATGGSGKLWTSTGQTGIISNKAGNVAYNTARFATIDLGLTDYYIRYDCQYLAGGITVRYTDSNNYYRVELGSAGSYTIIRRVAGANVTIASGPTGSIQTGATFGVGIKANVISVYNGTIKIASHTDTNPIVSGTRAGIMSAWSGEWYCDNFLATEFLAPYEAPIVTSLNEIIAWGDSLTAAGWPDTELEIDVSIPVTNKGVSGQGSNDIALRQGGISPIITVQNDQIPASGSVAVVTITPSTGWRTNGTGTFAFTGTLAGIAGSLVHDLVTNLWTFSRSASGVATAVPANSKFTITQTIPDHQKMISIFWTGRNNITALDQVDTATNGMVASLTTNPKAYLLLGVTNTSGEPSGSGNHAAIVATNDFLAAKHKDRFIDVRKHLIKYGLNTAGITPTSQDQTDIANDIIPTSLRSDATHFNEVGYRLVSKLVSARLRQLRQVAESTTTRRADLQPFTSETFSNVSIGSGITFSPEDAVENTMFQWNDAGFASSRWSISIVRAALTDPYATLTQSWGDSYLYIPTNAEPAAGTDMHLSVIQPDGYTLNESWGMQKVDDTHWTSSYAVTTDLRGSGMGWGARASGISQIHGIIRVHEIEQLNIPHTLSVSLDNDQLKSVAWATDPSNRGVWPARREDGDAASVYVGEIPMGSMYAIPSSVDINALGLTPAGVALAKCLQDYGAHVLIRASTVSLAAEPKAEEQFPERVAEMRSAWILLRSYMRHVTNNTSTNIAGGGTRRRPPALPLA